MRPLNELLHEIDEWAGAITSSATDYPDGWVIAPHSHGKHQLIHAIEGVMTVQSDDARWTVPPSRGIWMPAGQSHTIRCAGLVKMRSIFVQPDDALGLPRLSKAISISALLSELIKSSVDIVPPYSPDSREARIMRLILDEVCFLPTLPLRLAQPQDPRLKIICACLQDNPGDLSTVSDWSQRLQVDEKTIQRLFHKQTGMTFGQWRQQARLLLALEHIARGEKIIEVAGLLGYDSPSAFASMFKRQFGTTPSRFFQ